MAGDSELVTQANKAIAAIAAYNAAVKRLQAIDWTSATCGLLAEPAMLTALQAASAAVAEVREAVQFHIDNIMPEYLA